ncbi:signal recognition particle-docking protein FtsY, partial [Mycobacterium sp. CBMA295]|nr:signal recognition particle-docking protein FtsY [Mycolicibacterium sp. CBMA 295]
MSEGALLGLWIAIAVVAVLVVVALAVGLVRYRRRRISLSERDAAGPIDRSGGYTASSGITFSQSATPTLERIDTSGLPAVGDDATIPRDAPKRTISDVQLPEPPTETAAPEAPPVPEEPADSVAAPAAAAAPVEPETAVEPAELPGEAPDAVVAAVEEIAPAEGRMDRLRGRLAKSQNALGRSMLGLLGGGDLDEDSWEAV